MSNVGRNLPKFWNNMSNAVAKVKTGAKRPASSNGSSGKRQRMDNGPKEPQKISTENCEVKANDKPSIPTKETSAKQREIYKLQNFTSKLKQDYKEDRKEDFEYFFGKKSPFSHFHPAAFEIDGIKYKCVEQYMMHQKAVIFKDKKHAAEIMATTEPKACKKLGRKVKNFDKHIWGRESIEVVKKGNIAKFSQNKELKTKLFATFPKIMAEASPRDLLWGIGLGSKNEKAHNRKTWRGKNKLGYCLSEVRNELMKEEGFLE